MPQSKLWEKALDWQRQYGASSLSYSLIVLSLILIAIYIGDLVYLENLGKSLLIVNSYETAVELLGKRSAIYSSRPPSVMAEL